MLLQTNDCCHAVLRIHWCCGYIENHRRSWCQWFFCSYCATLLEPNTLTHVTESHFHIYHNLNERTKQIPHLFLRERENGNCRPAATMHIISAALFLQTVSQNKPHQTLANMNVWKDAENEGFNDMM